MPPPSAACGTPFLGEGRNFWFFASSDWHEKRARTATNSSKSTTNADFWGQASTRRTMIFVKNERKCYAQDILNGMRSGNSYVVQGDLIDGLEFSAVRAENTSWGWRLIEKQRKDHGRNAQGSAGDLVVVTVKVRDPEGTQPLPQ